MLTFLALALPSLQQAIILCIVLAVCGTCFKLIQATGAIAEPFKTAIYGIAVLVVVIVILRMFGII